MNIYFIYRKSQEDLGSVKMRVFQLKDLLKLKLIDIDCIGIYSAKFIIFHYYWVSLIKRDSFVIFNKDSIDRAPHKIINLLRKKNVKIGVDLLDKDLNRFDYRKVDYLISSSNRQHEYLQSVVRSVNSKAEVLMLPHQADLRLKQDGVHQFSSSRKRFKIFYFGEHTNIYAPTKYLNKIDIIPYDGEMRDYEINLMKKYKFQYCIRGPQQNTSLYIFKPITKIINSYYLGALPIISFDMEDAVLALGVDYPFKLQSYSEEGFKSLFERIANSSEEDINLATECVKNLENSHGFDAVCDNFQRIIRTV